MTNQSEVTCAPISGRWDRLGSMASTLCALHCLIVPISLILGPLMPLPEMGDVPMAIAISGPTSRVNDETAPKFFKMIRKVIRDFVPRGGQKTASKEAQS